MLHRPLTESDIARCVEIERASSDYPWAESIFRRSLKQRHWAFVTINSADQLMAFCVCQRVADECSVLNLAVDPIWQRQGFGRNLLKAGLVAARAEGAQHAFLEVRQSNRAAQALYEAMGFDLVGLRENYYPVNSENSYEHALLMGLDLTTWHVTE